MDRLSIVVVVYDLIGLSVNFIPFHSLNKISLLAFAGICYKDHTSEIHIVQHTRVVEKY